METTLLSSLPANESGLLLAVVWTSLSFQMFYKLYNNKHLYEDNNFLLFFLMIIKYWVLSLIQLYIVIFLIAYFSTSLF